MQEAFNGGLKQAGELGMLHEHVNQLNSDREGLTAQSSTAQNVVHEPHPISAQ